MRPNCYNCDEKPARANSVFCQTCAPDNFIEATNKMLPAIIHEDNAPPRPPEGWRRWLTRLFAPYRHASNLAARFEALYRELQDTAQSNLALRRKCADLKAQRDAMLQASGEECEERMHLGASITELQNRLADCTGQQGQLKLESDEWKARADAAERELAEWREGLRSA